MTTRRILPLLFVLSVAAACTAFGLRKADYRPDIKATEFVPVVDNPYYPLVPGTTYKLVERLGKHVSENTITVTPGTKTIMGVTCVVVRDQVFEKGALMEDTFDWFAQDRQGNVWYFGEDTKEFHEGGAVSTKGSWEAGVKGAQPGIVMPAAPAPGAPYRQEYLASEAEDMGQVVAVDEAVKVPAGAYTGCVRTKEWSELESGSDVLSAIEKVPRKGNAPETRIDIMKIEATLF